MNQNFENGKIGRLDSGKIARLDTAPKGKQGTFVHAAVHFVEMANEAASCCVDVWLIQGDPRGDEAAEYDFESGLPPIAQVVLPMSLIFDCKMI